MNTFEQGLTRYIMQEDLAKIRSVRVGLAGAGGLGSNCAQHLVRSGFNHLTLVDHDTVDSSNLNRQFFFEDQVGRFKVDMLAENLKRINPGLDVRCERIEIDKTNLDGVFSDCQVIVEAFDRVALKTLIVEKYINSDKLLVSASGMGGWDCSDTIHIKRIRPRFFMVGDFETQVDRDCPPLSPRVGIVAAKQAEVVLRVVTGRYDDKTEPM